MYTKVANKNQIREVWRICLPESMVKELWSLCHQNNLGGHRGLERTLNSRCDTCLTKETEYAC